MPNTILFQTCVAVPSDTIAMIGEGIRRLVITEMKNEMIYYDAYTKEDVNTVDTLITKAIEAYVDATKKSCNGFSLDASQARAVAGYMRRNQKILAIKEFRTHTGAGLKDAKDTLESFGYGEIGAMQFLSAFVS
jgi:ribosomal protein L7/L12